MLYLVMTIPIIEDTSKQPAMYVLTHVKSGKKYVGSTNDLRVRFNTHRKRLNRGIHTNRELLAAYNDDPQFTILIYLTENIEIARAMEQRYLDEHFDSGILFNVSKDAYSSNKGRPLSSETKEKQRQAMTGRKISEHHHQRILEGIKKRKTSGPYSGTRARGKVSVDGIVYESVDAASSALNLPYLTVYNRLNAKSPNSRFKEWFFIE